MAIETTPTATTSIYLVLALYGYVRWIEAFRVANFAFHKAHISRVCNTGCSDAPERLYCGGCLCTSYTLDEEKSGRGLKVRVLVAIATPSTPPAWISPWLLFHY